MALPVLHPVTERTVFAHLADVGTAGSAFAVAPFRGKIVKMGSVIATSLSSADAIITSKINGTSITGGGWTITQSGSAAGDVDTAIPTAANNVNEGDNIEFITDGGPGSTVPTTFFATIRAN